MNKKSYVCPETISFDLKIETTSIMVISTLVDDEVGGGTSEMPEEE